MYVFYEQINDDDDDFSLAAEYVCLIGILLSISTLLRLITTTTIHSLV